MSAIGIHERDEALANITDIVCKGCGRPMGRDGMNGRVARQVAVDIFPAASLRHTRPSNDMSPDCSFLVHAD
jgi:hypothetical protein